MNTFLLCSAKQNEGSHSPLADRQACLSGVERANLPLVCERNTPFKLCENINRDSNAVHKTTLWVVLERWPKIFARHNKKQNPKRRAKIKNESLSRQAARVKILALASTPLCFLAKHSCSFT